jgi:hypothetical protein
MDGARWSLPGGFGTLKSIVVVFTLIVSFCSVSLVHAQTRGKAFANLEYGSTPARVAEVLASYGFQPLANPTARPPDQQFSGQLKGERAGVLTFFTPEGSLEKMVVMFLTPNHQALSFFRTFKSELTTHFGYDPQALEVWKFPYEHGGHIGHEETALRLGKGYVGAMWEVPDAHIVLNISEDLNVVLYYESSRWGLESDRRKQVANRVF